MLVRLTVILTLFAASCGPSGAESAKPDAGPQAPASGTVEYALADFVKPRVEEGAVHDPYLAPILYLEAPHEAPLGAASAGSGGSPAVDASRAVVYVADETVRFDGADRRVLTHVWFRALEPVRAQGLRVVLDRDGLPAIAEVLRGASGSRTVWVARALEDRALEELGEPLPGRELAIEAEGVRAAGVELAGTFVRPTTALGPFVYVPRESGDVVHLHCRCTPSSVKAFRETVEYELVPLELLDGTWPTGDDPGFTPVESVEEWLRLPAAF